MPLSKNQQTSHYLGGRVSANEIAKMLAAGYTNAQIALSIGTTVAEVTRVLALPTPT